MWSKVAKLASPAPRKPAARLDAPIPAEQLFHRLRRVLDPDDAAAASSSSARAAEVERLLDALLQVLRAEEAQSETPPLGEALELLLENNSLGSLVDLVLDHGGDPALRAVLLRWYAEAIDRLDAAWLSHSAVNKPLTKLIGTCLSLGVDSEHELDFVTLLCVVSERIRSTPDLLPVFFRRRRASRERVADPTLSTRIAADFDPPLSPTLSQASTSENSFAFSASQAVGTLPSVVAAEHDCAVFSALVRYLHREGDLGEAARTGLLALIDVACSQTSLSFPQAPLSAFGGISDERRRSIASSPASATTPVGERDLVLALAEWILDSDLADVLGASLGALYGALPSKLVVRPVDDSSAAAAAVASAAAAPGGMVLGGMGALQEDEDAEITARRREEEDEALQNQGYGISGTTEFTRALDHFLRLFEFAQEVVERCGAVSSRYGFTVDGSRSPDMAADSPRRQQQLVLAAIASTITTAIRLSFLQSVFYPSLLECSETDGSVVAVLTYLEAVLEVLHDNSDFAAVVLAFLTGDDSRVEIPPAVARLRTSKLRSSPAASKHNRRRSQGLLLLDRPVVRPATATSSTDYYVSSDRFGLRDLLGANISSTHAATAAAALKLFMTILTKHDRWSLTLLDVELDDYATAFPAVPFASLPAAPDEVNSSSERASSDDDEFVYPVRTLSPPRRQNLCASVPPTPLSALRPLLEVGSSSSRIGKEVSADPLDVLLSLVGETTPSYDRRGGGESELVATGFQNYLRDAEAKLAREPGFRRGLVSLADVSESELSSTTCSSPRSPLLQGGNARIGDKRTASITHHELATTRTGRRHRLTAASSSSSSSPVVSSLLAALSAFFSHPPDVNLALTEAIATLALSPYRALDPWCLPNEVVPSTPFPNGGRRSTLFVAPDQLPTLAQSDSVLAILQALSGGIAEYRRRIPKFDDYLDDRRKGLFFADNLADALEGIDLASDPTPAPPPPPLEPSPLQPAAKASSMTAGLASFFSPRRRPSPAAHSRSPSTPPPPANAFSTPSRASTTAGSSTHQHRPSQLRRSASDESLVAPLSPSPITRLGNEAPEARGAGAGSRRLEELVDEDRQRQQRQRSTPTAGPASPFAAHYRETGSVQVEPILVATPSQVRMRGGTEVKTLGGEVDDEEDGDDGPGASPSRRLSPFPPPNRSIDEAPTPAVTDASPRGRGTVSLSTLLDNVIVLEEFVKELAAVVYVRRAVGIDPVRRVDTD
ncbi:hypothetical protein C6P46_001939 [Rhodotorula mucilaginosa]|uniref:FHF complex subunit HOOK-interacting protein C-terminal domain-containing protein n=1 Tax=Rhodotorula mucilaginosa TaxID=5537 RepID=A0A9P7B7C8_RHOMI|nr:hypothetical protein C6P46_001939 [Rhodotorula mucilaginosa]